MLGRRAFAAPILILVALPRPSQGQERGFEVDSGRIVSVDTTVYADIPTAELIALARARHLGRAVQLEGYQARLFTRLEGRAATSRFSRGVQIFGYETAANLTWRQPGDVRVDVVGARSAAVRMPGIREQSWATWWSEIFSDQLWFSPAALGDEIQLMGLPDQDALHPLATDAGQFYHYAIVDSVTIGISGRTVRAVAVRVEPTTTHPVLRRAAPVASHSKPTVAVDSVFEAHRERLTHRLDSISARARAGDPMTGREIADMFEGDLDVQIRQRGQGEGLARGPRTYSPTLVSGEMWLDADSLDVVRMIVTFVGDNVWDDDEDAPDLLSVEADLEYGLHDGRHWLPLRQVLAATFKYKYLPGAILPATAVTTFSDYDLTLPDSLPFSVPLGSGVTGRRVGAWRCPEPWEWDDVSSADDCADDPYVKGGIESDGTRWEITVPPLDTLLAFDFSTEFAHTVDLASAQFVEQRLPRMAGYSEQVAVPDRLLAFDWSAALSAFRFNRVQGPSLGFGAILDPRLDFTRVQVGGRLGLSDRRPVGFVTWQRDGPRGLFEISAYRSLEEREPWTDGRGVGNSFRALFFGHDEADYHLASGGEIRYRTRVGSMKNLSITLAAERHRSVETVAGSGVNDVFFGSGVFPTNPPVAEGDFLRGTLVKEFFPGAARLAFGVEGWAGSEWRSGRAWGLLDAGFSRSDVRARFRAKTGRSFGDRLPQSEFRAGGLETVRGYGYGARRGVDLWSAQLDLEWVVSQWWSPVVFGDVGNTSYATSPLMGIGAGVSALSGWLRLDLAKGINPGRPVRADLHFQIPLP